MHTPECFLYTAAEWAVGDGSTNRVTVLARVATGSLASVAAQTDAALDDAMHSYDAGWDMGYVAQLGIDGKGPETGRFESPPAGYNDMYELGLEILNNPSLELCIQHLCKACISIGVGGIVPPAFIYVAARPVGRLEI